MADPIIAVIAFDGMSPFHLSVPCLVFGEDRTALGLPRFDFRVCAIETGPIHTDAGLTITVPHGLSALDGADIVIVPSWKDLDAPPPTALIEALRRAHRRGALIVGLCLGTFAIAATGLLSGRRATTHWAYTGQLQALYPDLEVDAGRALCRRWRYRDVGRRRRRARLLPPHRARPLWRGGGAAACPAHRAFAAPARRAGAIHRASMARTADTDRFAQALDAVLATLGDPHSLDSVAEAAGLTRRTFTRRFQKSIGTSFGDWLAGTAHRVGATTAESDIEIDGHGGLRGRLRQRHLASPAFRGSAQDIAGAVPARILAASRPERATSKRGFI